MSCRVGAGEEGWKFNSKISTVIVTLRVEFGGFPKPLRITFLSIDDFLFGWKFNSIPLHKLWHLFGFSSAFERLFYLILVSVVYSTWFISIINVNVSIWEIYGESAEIKVDCWLIFVIEYSVVWFVWTFEWFPNKMWWYFDNLWIFLTLIFVCKWVISWKLKINGDFRTKNKI